MTKEQFDNYLREIKADSTEWTEKYFNLFALIDKSTEIENLINSTVLLADRTGIVKSITSAMDIGILIGYELATKEMAEAGHYL